MEEKTYGNILDVLREFAPESIDRFRDLATSDIRGIEDKIVHETSRELGAIEVSNPRVRELIQDLGIDGYQAEFTALRDAFAEEAAADAPVVDTDTEQLDRDDIGPDEDTEYHPALSYDGYDPEDFAPMEEPVRQNSSIPPSEEIENLSTFETPVAKDDAPKADPAAPEDTERPQPAASEAGTIRDLGREISGGTPNPFDHIARDTKFDAIVTTGNALLGLNRFTKQDLVREYGKIDGSRIYDDSMAKIQAAMSDARDGKISTRDFIDRFKEAYETAYETKSTRDEVIKDFRKELDSAVHAKDPVSRGEHMGNAYRNFVENRAYFKEALVEKGARESDAEKTMDRLERVFESAFDRDGSDASAGENLTDFSNQYAYAFNGTKGMPETARPDVPADRQQYLDRAEFWSHQGEKFVRYRSDLFSNASRLGESYNRMKAASGGVEKGVAVAGFVGDVARFLQSNALETVVLELVKVVVTYLSGAEVEKDIEKMIREYEPDIDRTDVPETDTEPMENLEQDPDKTELPDPEIPEHDETEKPEEDSTEKHEGDRDPDEHDRTDSTEDDQGDTERPEDPTEADPAEDEKDPVGRPEEVLDPTEKPEGDGVETAKDPAEQSEVEHTPEGEDVPESGAPDKSEADLTGTAVETAEEQETEADPVDADLEPDDAAASAVSEHGAEHAEEDRVDKSDVREAFASQKASGEDTEDEGNGVTVEEAVNAGEPTTDKNERGEPSVEREDDISDDRLTGMLDDYVAGDISAVDMMDLLGGNMRIEEAVMRLVGAEGGVENLTMERMDQLTDLLAEANEYTNGDTLKGLTTIANENPGLGWDIEQLQNGMIGKSWIDFDNQDPPMDIELGGATFVADETGLTGVSGSESFTGIEYVADPVEASMNDVIRDRVQDVTFKAPDPVEIPEPHDVDLRAPDSVEQNDPPAADQEFPYETGSDGAENVFAGGADMDEAVEAAAVIL